MISIFGHFLDQEYRYQNILLAFKGQLGQYTGANIATIVHKVLLGWGIPERVGVTITDNATNNDAYIKALYPALEPSMTLADIVARRIRYFGHILNLTAQAFLLRNNPDAFEHQSQIFRILGQEEEDLDHWRSRGPIGKLHNIVRFIRASPQRIEAFRQHAKEVEELDYMLSEESTWELSVIQNNATRWNSTYLMIDRAIQKIEAITSFIAKLALEVSTSQLPTADILSRDD